MAAPGAVLTFIRRLEAAWTLPDGERAAALARAVGEAQERCQPTGDLAALVGAAELIAALAEGSAGRPSPEAAFYVEAARRLRQGVSLAESGSRPPAR